MPKVWNGDVEIMEATLEPYVTCADFFKASEVDSVAALIKRASLFQALYALEPSLGFSKKLEAALTNIAEKAGWHLGGVSVNDWATAQAKRLRDACRKIAAAKRHSCGPPQWVTQILKLSVTRKPAAAPRPAEDPD